MESKGSAKTHNDSPY